MRNPLRCVCGEGPEKQRTLCVVFIWVIIDCEGLTRVFPKLFKLDRNSLWCSKDPHPHTLLSDELYIHPSFLSWNLHSQYHRVWLCLEKGHFRWLRKTVVIWVGLNPVFWKEVIKTKTSKEGRPWEDMEMRRCLQAKEKGPRRTNTIISMRGTLSLQSWGHIFLLLKQPGLWYPGIAIPGTLSYAAKAVYHWHDSSCLNNEFILWQFHSFV